MSMFWTSIEYKECVSFTTQFVQPSKLLKFFIVESRGMTFVQNDRSQLKLLVMVSFRYLSICNTLARKISEFHTL